MTAMKQPILGIDEAGRGSVLGPLVICGFMVEEERLPDLDKLHLADSKALSPGRREELAGELRRFPGRILLTTMPPALVDSAVYRNGLNGLEISAMVRMMRQARPATVYIDALTSRPRKFGDQVRGLLAPLTPRVVAENKADTRYPVVMAASILAKVARDSAIARLSKRLGEIGSGYPGDPRTRDFLSGFSKTCDYPPCVRRSWATLENIRLKK